MTIYGLRRFASLASKGSPTVLLLFFIRGEDVLQQSELGAELQALAPAFLSARTGRAFLGYLGAQARSLRGERHATRTRELSSAHGYDTKFAMHALRIGHQGIDLLRTGEISLPVHEPAWSHLREVRAGTTPLEQVLADIAQLERELGELTDASRLPAEPDRSRINAFLKSAYQRWWSRHGS